MCLRTICRKTREVWWDIWCITFDHSGCRMTTKTFAFLHGPSMTFHIQCVFAENISINYLHENDGKQIDGIARPTSYSPNPSPPCSRLSLKCGTSLSYSLQRTNIRRSARAIASVTIRRSTDRRRLVAHDRFAPLKWLGGHDRGYRLPARYLAYVLYLYVSTCLPARRRRPPTTSPGRGLSWSRRWPLSSPADSVRPHSRYRRRRRPFASRDVVGAYTVRTCVSAYTGRSAV